MSGVSILAEGFRLAKNVINFEISSLLILGKFALFDKQVYINLQNAL